MRAATAAAAVLICAMLAMPLRPALAASNGGPGDNLDITTTPQNKGFNLQGTVQGNQSGPAPASEQQGSGGGGGSTAGAGQQSAGGQQSEAAPAPVCPPTQPTDTCKVIGPEPAPQMPTPNDLTLANSPPPSLQPYLAQVFGEIGVNGGTIKAAPPNGTGLVNLPVCFWVEGLAVPDRRTVALDLPGAPTAAGQRIIYHIDLTVSLAHADWDFGDGSSDGVVPPLQCQQPSGGAPSLVAHNYTRYSDGQPQGKFQVSVQERYEARVNLRWTDEVGAHSQPVSLGDQGAQTLRAGPYPIKIEQEEGVPVAPGR